MSSGSGSEPIRRCFRMVWCDRISSSTIKGALAASLTSTEATVAAFQERLQPGQPPQRAHVLQAVETGPVFLPLVALFLAKQAPNLFPACRDKESIRVNAWQGYALMPFVGILRRPFASRSLATCRNQSILGRRAPLRTSIFFLSFSSSSKLCARGPSAPFKLMRFKCSVSWSILC